MTAVSPAQGAPCAPTAIRPAIDSLLRRARVPGCSVAFVSATGTIWSDGFGYADVASREAATRDTVYPLFSGTKLYTATATMQLVERGALRLEDPVARYVPATSSLAGLQLVHLLSHQSGLADSLRGFLSVTFPGERPRSAAEALRGFPLRARRAPGTRVEYGNVNYALLGAVVSRVTGMEYSSWVREHILAPLGSACDFTYPMDATHRMATGYVDWWDPMRAVLWYLDRTAARRVTGARCGAFVALRPYHLATAAIGGLVGTVPEFARFLQAHLREGDAILEPSSVVAMQRQVASGAAGMVSRVGVGLGWKLGRAGHRTFVNHEGGGAGFTSELRLYPAEGLGVAISMNAMRMPATMRLAHEIAELVSGPAGESAPPREPRSA